MIKQIALATLLGTVAATADNNKLVIEGSTTVGPIAKAFAESLMSENPALNITVSESGSGNGVKALLNGTCDIATISRELKESERTAMKARNVTPVLHTAAYDALPVIVHPSNKVAGLSLAQLRKIYTGEISNWKEVGGFDRAIVVISRDTNSGTFETFSALVLGADAKVAARAEYAGSNGAVRGRVQSTPGAIGYVGLGFMDHSVKTLAVDGVAPSVETVLDSTYPIARKLYMVTNGTPGADTLCGQFVAMTTRKEGREIVEETGFVPVPEDKPAAR